MTEYHQDRNGVRISWRLGVIVTLAAGAFTGVWWAGGFAQEVQDMQSRILENEEFSETMGVQVYRLDRRAAAAEATTRGLEKRLDSIDRALARIESKIDRNGRGVQ